MTDLQVRLMQPGELAYVKATWLKHYKEHSEFARPIRDSVYYPAHSRIVDHLLARPKTSALIAAHEAEPDVILGFLVYEPALIHYAYVVSKARMMGVATEMLKAAGLTDQFTFTHRTQDAKAIAMKNQGMTYDPYRI